MSPPTRAPSADVDSMQMYKRLMRYVRPHLWMLAIAIVFTILSGATDPLLPALMKPMFDSGFRPDADSSLLWKVPAGVIGLFLARGVFGFMSGYAFAWVANRTIRDIRKEMFDAVMLLPDHRLRGQPSSVFVQKVVSEVNGVADACVSSLTTLVREPITVLGLLGLLFYSNWRLTLISAIALPLSALVVRLFSKRLRVLSRKSLDNARRLNQLVQESVLNQRIVKIFRAYPQMNRRFDSENSNILGVAMRQSVAASLSVPLSQFIASFALAAVIYFGLKLSMSGELTVGGFVSYITAMLMLLTPMKRLADVSAPLQRGLASAESVFELLDDLKESLSKGQTLNAPQGHLEFKNVGFTYPGAEQASLIDIDLSCAPGQTLALVGGSGGGKSTLATLIPRLNEVTSGALLLDGIDVRDLSLDSLRQHIAYVSQETLLFDDTVRANIAMGVRHEVSMDDIRAAAKAAHALDFIEQLPEGFDTVIGENGSRLSGGQRQRISIARALLKNAPILILDEATSALDNESEKAVQAALDALMQNRTTVVIAHRLSTIEGADRIAVLDKGRLVEQGSHEALLARKGAYAHLHALQFNENKEHT